MKNFILFSLIFAFALCTNAFTADFYTWTDKDGTVHITDYPPPVSQMGNETKIHKGARDQEPPQAEQAVRKIDIILFTKNECQDCDKARDFLTDQNLSFKEYNMDTDANAINKRKEIDSADDVPFAVINRTQIYGFSETVYKRALKAAP